jgi:hypothetical protein
VTVETLEAGNANEVLMVPTVGCGGVCICRSLESGSQFHVGACGSKLFSYFHNLFIL